MFLAETANGTRADAVRKRWRQRRALDTTHPRWRSTGAGKTGRPRISVTAKQKKVFIYFQRVVETMEPESIYAGTRLESGVGPRVRACLHSVNGSFLGYWSDVSEPICSL
jgi:hypothetical protein